MSAITITEAAQDYLADLLGKQNTPGIGIRIFITQPGTQYAETCLAYCKPGEQKHDDTAFALKDFTAWLDAVSLPFLEDAVVDYATDRMGGQLTIKAPNAKVPMIGEDSPLPERINYYLQTEINPGLASHGGAFGVLMAILLFVRQHPQTGTLWLMDRLAIPTALTGCFIRLGNFMNSEIVGLPTGGNWGVVFERIDALPRHPVQLYESLCYFVIFVLLLQLYRRQGMQRPGFGFGLFMILVFGCRLVLEFFKTPQADYEAGNLITVGQWLSVPFILLGLFCVWRSRRH